MSSTNVEKFAAELKMPAEVLLEQLREAGVKKNSPADTLTEADKEQLLAALRRAHGGDDGKKKITLTRKQTSEIKQADGTGKARTIQVEVRKKRVFVKRDQAEAAPEVVPEPTGPSEAELEQQRLREEEEQRQRELLERQAAELREKQERLEEERRREAEAAAEAARREEEARREQERAAAMQEVEEGSAKSKAEEEARVAAEAARKAQQDAEAQARARRAVENEVAEINRLMAAQLAGSGGVAGFEGGHGVGSLPTPDPSRKRKGDILHRGQSLREPGLLLPPPCAMCPAQRLPQAGGE